MVVIEYFDVQPRSGVVPFKITLKGRFYPYERTPFEVYYNDELMMRGWSWSDGTFEHMDYIREPGTYNIYIIAGLDEVGEWALK